MKYNISCKSSGNVQQQTCHIFTHLAENNELKNISAGKKNQHKTDSRK